MKKNIIFVLIVVLFLSFVAGKFMLNQPLGTPLEGWLYNDGDGIKSITLPDYHILDTSGVHTYTFRTGKLDAPFLVIPQLYGYAYKLYLNGHYISGIGSFEHPTANLWSYAQAIDLSAFQHPTENTLQLEIYGLHDVGLNAIPFLADEETATWRVTLINMMNHDLILLFIGFALAFALLFFFLALKIHHRKSIYLRYGIALALFAFYSLEFTFRATSGTIEQYLWGRKLLLISIYLAGYFLLLGQRAYFLNRETSRLFSIVYTLPLIFMISAKDFIAISHVQSYFNVISMATVLYIAFIGLITRYKATLVPNTILVITAMHAIINVLFELRHPYILHLGVMSFLFGLCTIIVMDFQVLESENKALGQLSKTDPLTQALNRSALNTLSCSSDDCFVFIDLDKFKAYNDTFGHQQGDQLLKDIVAIFKKNMRKTDCVIRYGGDEFILYFKGSIPEDVEKTILRIQQSVRLLGAIDFSYGISSYQDSIVSTVLNADRLMYAMKNNDNA